MEAKPKIGENNDQIDKSKGKYKKLYSSSELFAKIKTNLDAFLVT